MKKILITDSLFIYKEHEDKLHAAGFEFERLDVPCATEEQLIEKLKDKHGYILGGVERVTEKVIASLPLLEVITFTGSDWKKYIPGYAIAFERGIHISNTPGLNTKAVAEYTLTCMLAMTREIFDLGRTGEKTFKTTKSIFTQKIGIVGMGHIGKEVLKMLHAIGVTDISYWNRMRNKDLENEYGVIYKDLKDLVKESDIVTLHTAQAHGIGYFDKSLLSLMKDDALIVNCGYEAAFNFDDLYLEIASGRLRAAHDGTTPDARFKNLPLYNWWNSNSHTAYNTKDANKAISDRATESMINLLNGKGDIGEVF